MFSTKNQKKFSIIAGICFATISFFRMIGIFYSDAPFKDLQYVAATIAISVLMFMQKKKLPFVIVSGIYSSLCLTDIFANFDIISVLDFFAYSTLFFLALINFIPAMHKNIKIQQYICFVPSALIILSGIISDGPIYFLWSQLVGAALFFTGFWLVNIYTPSVDENSEFATVNTENVVEPTPTSAPANNESISDIDKLMAYKKLLDDGIITQEEFDKKKTQLLNLL